MRLKSTPKRASGTRSCREEPVLNPAGYPVRELGWMISDFIERVPAVAHALVVSSDGIPVACSAGLPPTALISLRRSRPV